MARMVWPVVSIAGASGMSGVCSVRLGLVKNIIPKTHGLSVISRCGKIYCTVLQVF